MRAEWRPGPSGSLGTGRPADSRVRLRHPRDAVENLIKPQPRGEMVKSKPPLLAGLVLTSAQALADVVAPSPDVTTRVIVRASVSSQSAQIGSLLPGQQLELIGSVPNWHEGRLPGGAQGFVSKRWTVVVPTTPGPAPAAAAPTFTIDVVDVGTGLGILVRGPDFTLIYDGGSNDDLARGPANRMLAYLRAVAPTLTTINHLVLSHPHRDHVELLPDLFDAYQIGQVWDSGRTPDGGRRSRRTPVALGAAVAELD
jgi:competence protein ComEC